MIWGVALFVGGALWFMKQMGIPPFRMPVGHASANTVLLSIGIAVFGLIVVIASIL